MLKPCLNLGTEEAYVRGHVLAYGSPEERFLPAASFHSSLSLSLSLEISLHATEKATLSLSVSP